MPRRKKSSDRKSRLNKPQLARLQRKRHLKGAVRQSAYQQTTLQTWILIAATSTTISGANNLDLGLDLRLQERGWYGTTPKGSRRKTLETLCSIARSHCHLTKASNPGIGVKPATAHDLL